MKERDYVASMLLKLRKIPRSWWYKIPDVRICGNCGKVATSDKRPFDVIGVVNGTPIAIEFKMEEGKVLPHQEAQLMLFARAGGKAAVARPGEVLYTSDGTTWKVVRQDADIWARQWG